MKKRMYFFLVIAAFSNVVFGMDSEIQRIEWQKSLHNAIVNNYGTVIEGLLNFEGGIEQNINRYVGYDQLCTPLYLACSRSNVDLVEWLLCNGANVNKKSTSGILLLPPLATVSDPVICRMLLDWGAQVNEMLDCGHTTFACAVGLGHVDAASMKLMLKRGANPNTTWNKKSLVERTAELGCSEKIILLLEYGAQIPDEVLNNVSEYDHEIQQLLQYCRKCVVCTALFNTSLDNQFLLKNKSSSNVFYACHKCMNFCQNIFAHKIENDSPEDVKLIFQRYPYSWLLDGLNGQGEFPLFVAAKNRAQHSFKALISLGAKINNTTKDGKTLWHAVRDQKIVYQLYPIRDLINKCDDNKILPIQEVRLSHASEWVIDYIDIVSHQYLLKEQNEKLYLPQS